MNFDPSITLSDILSLVIGFFFGGSTFYFVGYKIGISKSVKQSANQTIKGSSISNVTQIGSVSHD